MQEGSEKPRHKVEFEGEMIRVKEGPFTDFNGSIEEANYERTSACRSRFWSCHAGGVGISQIEKDLIRIKTVRFACPLHGGSCVFKGRLTPGAWRVARRLTRKEKRMAKKIVGFVKL